MAQIPVRVQHRLAVRSISRVYRRVLSVRASASSPSLTEYVPPPISLTDKALSHLKKLRQESSGDELLLRVGVKEGGCSGMSYVMDFEKATNVTGNDTVIPYDGGEFKLVTDPKSLLYLFGMELDYSSALINGGFKFENPNASKTCGCGKSFGVQGQKAVVVSDCNSA